MYLIRRHSAAVLFVAALAPLLSAGAAHAQTSRRPSRLSAVQQQNAQQQQQSAVQSALQQTSALLQSAAQLSSSTQQVSAPSPINLQQQQAALQIALQQTTALLQVGLRQNSSLSQSALRQLNTLQGVWQQTLALQGTLSMQVGQLTTAQVQTLSQEQSSLMGLLTSQPPTLPSRMSRK
jgi:hypothetical protein